MKRENHIGHLVMFIANILWGFMAPISKEVLSHGFVNPISLTTFRMLGAAILFWFVSLFCKKEEVSPQDLVKLFFAALFGIVLNQASYIYGISLTSPINASIVSTTTPIITMIIAAIYLKEPITGKKITGIFVGASGAMLLILSSRQVVSISGNSDALGDLFCLFSQFCFSIYFVLFKGLIGRYSPVTLMKWMFMYSFICCIPFSYNHISAIDFATMPTNVYMEVLYIIVGGTFISYLLVPIGQKTLRPTVAIMYNYIQPIIASIIAILWGMDTFGLMKTGAIVLVFAGVYIVTQSKSKAQMDAERAAKATSENSAADANP